MDQHMGDDITQGFLVFSPVVQDRAAVEPDPVRKLSRFHGKPFGNSTPFEKAKQIERRFKRHVLENVIVREIFDLNGEIGGEGPEFFRKMTIGIDRKRLERAYRWRMAILPVVCLVNASHWFSLCERHIRPMILFFEIRIIAIANEEKIPVR
ncbi:hypothetical protein D3C87_1661320 [compost metagenome]